VRVVIQRESRRTANVIKKEAKPERTRGLIDFRMLADARRDKTPVIAR
jgi:hypothetical protein